jgi:hypothetical protein
MRNPTPVLGIHKLKAYADGRFGMDDRTQHPQFFCTFFEYICCIPRELPEDLAYLRWTPTIDDCPTISERISPFPMRRLKPYFLTIFTTYRCEYSKRARDWIANYPKDTLVSSLDLHLTQALSRLVNMGMTLKEIIFTVAELQRTCLDIHAFIDFKGVYLRRSVDEPHEVNPNLMGAFTQNFNTAYELFMRGIPVWYIRPSFRIAPDMNVRKHCDFEQPACVLDNWSGEDFPVLCEGYSGTVFQRHQQRIGMNILDLANPASIASNVSDISIAPNVTVSLASATRRPLPCTCTDFPSQTVI